MWQTFYDRAADVLGDDVTDLPTSDLLTIDEVAAFVARRFLEFPGVIPDDDRWLTGE